MKENTRQDLHAWLDAHDFDELPDGAWFAVLEQSAEEFAENYGLKNFDANSAVHAYLKDKDR